MMGAVGIGIQGNGQAKLSEGVFSLSIEQERLAQEPMLHGIGWLLVDSQFEFADSAAVVFLRHVGATEAAMPLFPIRVLPVKFAQFGDGRVEIAVVAVRISEIVADRSFVWGDVFGFAILCDGLLEFAVLMQDQAKIAVGLPERTPTAHGITLGGLRGNEPSISMQGNAHVVVRVGIVGIASQRLGKGMSGCSILAV